jgi:hypothetical protein
MIQSLHGTSMVRVPDTTHSDAGRLLSPAMYRAQLSLSPLDQYLIPVASISPSSRENNVTREITPVASGSNLH